MKTTPQKWWASFYRGYAQHISNERCRTPVLVVPLNAKAIEKMQDKVARAIHAEVNRHEGEDVPWASLHRYTRGKYRGKAYAALVALGVITK